MRIKRVEIGVLLGMVVLTLLPAVYGVSWDDDAKIFLTYYGARNDVAIRGDYAYYTVKNELKIANIADEAFPRLTSVFKIGGFPGDVTLLGKDHLCVLNGTRLIIFNVKDPFKPELVSSLVLGAPELFGPICIEVIGDKGYVACARKGLLTLDLKDPAAPKVLYELTLKGVAIDLAIDDNKAYIGCDSGISVVDISGAEPKLLGYVDTYRSARSIVAKDGYAFIGSKEYYQAYDLRDPANPKTLGEVVGITFVFNQNSYDMDLVGDLIYVANGEAGLYIMDWTDKANPKILVQFGNWENPDKGVHYVWARGLCVHKGLVYATETQGDLLVFQKKREDGVDYLSLERRGGRLDYEGGSWPDMPEDPSDCGARGIALRGNVLHDQFENKIRLFELRNSGEPIIRNMFSLPGRVTQISPLWDGYVGVVNGRHFAVFDYEKIRRPFFKGNVALGKGGKGGPQSFAVDSATKRIYAACGEGGIRVVDAQDVSNLKEVEEPTVSNAVTDVVYDNACVYGVGSNGLVVAKVEGDEGLSLVSSVSTEAPLTALAKVGAKLVAADSGSRDQSKGPKLYLLDVANAAEAKLVSTMDLEAALGAARQLVVQDGSVFVCFEKGILALNVSDAIAVKARYSSGEDVLRGIAVGKETIYAKLDNGSVRILSLSENGEMKALRDMQKWWHE